MSKYGSTSVALTSSEVVFEEPLRFGTAITPRLTLLLRPNSIRSINASCIETGRPLVGVDRGSKRNLIHTIVFQNSKFELTAKIENQIDT